MDVKGEGVKNGTEFAAAGNGVLFPRLNVKETKTSGPRAPPRNKMALYEQFTIPSHRFVQSTHGAVRQNPTALLNAPASCDGRFVYAPYYVSPKAYTTVNYPGQVLGQTLICNSNGTATDYDRSAKCGLAKNREQSSGTATYSARASKAHLNQNFFLASGKDAGEAALQTSGRVSSSVVTDGATLGGLPLSKSGSLLTGGACEDLKVVAPKLNSLCQSECPVQHSLSTSVQNDEVERGEREPDLCSKNSQCTHGDCVCEALSLHKCSNKGTEDDCRVNYDDNLPSKNSSISDNIAHSKGADHYSSKREHQTTLVVDSPGAHEHPKTSSASVESNCVIENTARGQVKVVDDCEGHENNKDPRSRDQHKPHLYSNHHSTGVSSGSLGNGKGDFSDHNSDSSMLDSIYMFDITPKNVIAAIGQREFWKFRKAILRQQKIFSTQVFELHRLVKVQKLIAMSPSLLIEDSAIESTPVCSSEEQCVPSINPEKFSKTSAVHINQESKIATNEGKPGNKEMPTHCSNQFHPSSRGNVQTLAHYPRDQLCAAPISLATFVPGSPSAWGYPAYPPTPFVGMASHPGGYPCYHQYSLNHLTGSNAVMGIPCPLEVNPMGSPYVQGLEQQSQCPAEYQAGIRGCFSKHPFQDGSYYNSAFATLPLESFSPWGRASNSFSDAGRSVGNGSGEEMSAGSSGSETGLKQSKQVMHLSAEMSRNAYRSLDSASRISAGENNRPVSQTKHRTSHSNYRNSKGCPSSLLSEREQHDASAKDDKLNATNWSLPADVGFTTAEFAAQVPEESQENDARIQTAIDLENQALSLFPMSSSLSCFSEVIKDKSGFSSTKQRVHVIKAVPRAAMAASESTADILLSLQRERQR